MDKMCKSYSYFSIRSFERGICESITSDDVILLSSQGKGYYPRDKITDKDSILNKYKVIITYAMSGGNKPSSSGDYQVVSSLQILKPNEVVTETYLVVGAFDTKMEAESLATYISTKFFRFLLLQALTSIHITKDSFCFIPVQSWDHEYTDEELYSKYKLSTDERLIVENLIKATPFLSDDYE